MTVWAIILSMLIVGGSIYIVTKIIENMFCADNSFLGFLNTFGAFIAMAAIVFGIIYLIFVLASYIEVVLIAL